MPRPQPFIGPADDAILRALLRYHYLSIRQVTRLLYSAGSFTYVSTRLKSLADAGYAQRLIMPTRRGNGPTVYALARKGMHALRELGIAIPPRARPSEERAHSYLFFAHTLAVNDFLIATELLCQAHPQLQVQRLLHERTLKHTPLTVTDADGSRLIVIPDAFVDLLIDGQDQMCLSLEVDRGTEEQKAWKRKVRALVAYAEGPYRAAFHTSALTIAVIATPGARRLHTLLHWTEEELTRRAQTHTADLFRFTAVALEIVTPEDLYFAPCWQAPFSRQPVALLESV